MEIRAVGLAILKSQRVEACCDLRICGHNLAHKPNMLFPLGNRLRFQCGPDLVSHYSAIGDTISCDAPYGAIGFKDKLFLRYPPCLACLWIAIGHFKERSGGVAAIVCDTTGNTVRQGYSYTCLAIWGGISVGSLRGQSCW